MAVTLFINDQCQLNCRYCFGWKDKSITGNRLSVKQISGILDVIWSKKHRYLTITGGEPFLHPEIKTIIQDAHDRGFWINILTNGLAIDDSMAIFLSRFWRIQVRVSMEGADAANHEFFRGVGTFRQMLMGIEAMRAHNVHVNIGLTIYEENADQIKPVVMFCIENGCSALRVVPVVRIEKGRDAKVSVELYENALRDIIVAIIENKQHIQFPRQSMMLDLPVAVCSTKKCIAGKGFLGINADSTIMPCSLLRFGDGVFINKYQGGADLDNMENKMAAYFQNITKNLRGKCGQCEHRSQCGGGCVGEKLSFGLSAYDEQPVCMKNILEKVLKAFDISEAGPVLDLWIRQMNSSLEDVTQGYCMRQSPFWKIAFA